ncbi:phospholipase A [uncultured Muribaculum sp.]|uniref:phospholipase A n=1 Tax=uncultured Muribaculum sp. TaxID=1918613 RepID=UPI002674762A|nr:phospholipase A [uncultured Muribaculum sp.]
MPIFHTGVRAAKYMAIAICISFAIPLNAQIHNKEHSEQIDADSVRREFDKGPYFTLYKDNYFIFGPSIGPKATKNNTNVKFQVSIRQKLTKSTLPGGTYLYLCYTQKVFWNILEKSLPMTDLNFNPGIGLAKPVFKNGKYIGKFILQLEHESNGRDSIESRSWNRLSLGGDILITNNFLVHAKIWIPYVDGEHNKDLLKYVGIVQAGAELTSNDRRWKYSLLLTKRKNWHLDFNTVAEISWQFSRNADWNLFAQYYNGYGEGLLDYNKFSSHLRVGVVIRPKLFSNY